LGSVSVVKMSQKQLEELIAKTFIDYLRYPNISVRPLMRATVLGGFFRPGLYYVDPNASLWQLVGLAGGTLRADGINKIRWERDRAVVSKDLVPAYQSGQSLSTLGFRSGDQLCVTQRPQSDFWTTARNEVLPWISITVGLITPSLTLYQLYVRSR
jgi:protein involved in polysaccharide export with SLBB domain